MLGANSLKESSFTDDDLNKLNGLTAGGILKWRNEICILVQISPLIVSPLWDYDDDVAFSGSV